MHTQKYNDGRYNLVIWLASLFLVNSLVLMAVTTRMGLARRAQLWRNNMLFRFHVSS